eukprot:gene7777-8623_t
MGGAASVDRCLKRKTRPINQDVTRSLKTSILAKPSLGEDSYRRRKLTKLGNPFQFSFRWAFVPSSLEYFVKESDEEKKIDFFSDDYASNMMLQPDELCFICNVYSTSEDLFTCRVCMKSFHEGCLEKIGNLSSEVSKLHASAISKSTIGWSCYKCSNLSLLLKEDEMHDIMDRFDDYDTNQDTQISLEEYIKYRERKYRKETKETLPKDLRNLAEDEFKIIDRDVTGTIDWWEFLNHETVKILRTREKKDLVHLLSPKEVANAREKFSALDVDKDGKITAFEAQKVYNDWFCKLSLPLMSGKPVNGRKPVNKSNLSSQRSTIESHAHNHAMLVMEADVDANKYVDWQEYLENEAICIIGSRPNMPMPALLNGRGQSKETK